MFRSPLFFAQNEIPSSRLGFLVRKYSLDNGDEESLLTEGGWSLGH